MSITYEFDDEALRLLANLEERMPHYTLDDEFRDALPPELVPYMDHWRETARP